MPDLTPETRPAAPGALGVLQEFMNSAGLARLQVAPEVVSAVRGRHAAGVGNATIAAELDLGQNFVAAITRGARLNDQLATPELASPWLITHGLLARGEAVDAAALEQVHELRELLRSLAESNNGALLDPAVPAKLDRLAAAHPLAVRFHSNRDSSLVPLEAGPRSPVPAILAVVHEAMRDGSFQRLKRCRGDGCPHTFYDASRNRTGTWCAMSVCGNRTKVRNYQRRRRTAGPR